MDLRDTWQRSSGSDDMLRQMLRQETIEKLQSKMPLKKLKNNLLTGMVLAVTITAGYIVLFFFVNAWQVVIALCTMVIFNTWLLVESWKLYENTNAAIFPSESVKAELQRNYESFQHCWSLQQRVSLFVYPIATAGGFILGGMSGSGKPAEAFLNDWRILLALGITIVVLMPVCYYFARWMFNYAYGKHLAKLKSLIEELS